MLRRYLKNLLILRIPFVEESLYLLQDGRLMDSNMQEQQASASIIVLNTNEGVISLDRDVLRCILYKGCRLPSTFWDKLNVLKIDDSSELSSMVLKYPTDGIRPLDNDHRSIPGFSRYLIDSSGRVYSLCKKDYLRPYVDANGYWMFGCQPDVGNRTIIGMHRLLALAFLPYPENVDALDVNHKDGIKDNNDLSNLEWASRKRNCEHAYSTGLRTDNIPVSVRNSVTGEVKDFYSLEDCARSMGLDGETVRLRVKSDGKKVFPPHHQFRSKDIAGDWYVPVNITADLLRKGLPKKVVVRDIITNQECAFDALYQAAQYLGVKRGMLGWRLNAHGGITLVGNNEVSWLEYEQVLA